MINNVSRFVLYDLMKIDFHFNISLKLAYVFHTEKIYDQRVYKILLSFVRSYCEITSKRCILTVMTPNNYFIKREMRRVKCSEAEYIKRLFELSRYAVIGYHGHFYGDEGVEIKGSLIYDAFVFDQFDNEISWLENNFDEYSRVYSAGWWYLSDIVIKKLIEYDFYNDYSFSYAEYFGCDYSKKIMKNNGVFLGEAFSIKSNKSLKFIQNFIGCHDTPYPQDFIRRFNKLVKNSHSINKNMEGVVNNHDYNLLDNNDYYTLKCIERIMDERSSTICDHGELGSVVKAIDLSI